MTTVTPESRLPTAGRLRVRYTRRRRPAVDNRGSVGSSSLIQPKILSKHREPPLLALSKPQKIVGA
jgi:hypothetical protein